MHNFHSLILIAFLAAVIGIVNGQSYQEPFTLSAAGVAQIDLYVTNDTVDGNYTYFRIDSSQYQNYAYIRMDFEACQGAIRLYYTSCVPASVSCNNGAPRWFPNAVNGGISIYSTYGNNGQPLLTTGKMNTRSSIVYFFGVEVTKWSPNSKPLKLRVRFSAYNASEGGSFGDYTNSPSLTSKGNTISYQPIIQCTKVNTDGSCAQSITFNNNTFYYVQLNDAESGLYNIGTACGLELLKQIGNAKPATHNYYYTFTGAKNGVFYVVNFGYQNNSDPRNPDFVYQPMLWSNSSNSSSNFPWVYILLIVLAISFFFLCAIITIVVVVLMNRRNSYNNAYGTGYSVFGYKHSTIDRQQLIVD